MENVLFVNTRAIYLSPNVRAKSPSCLLMATFIVEKKYIQYKPSWGILTLKLEMEEHIQPA